YIPLRAIRHLEKGRLVIFAAGNGNPYFTTDTTAALRAAEIGAEAVLKGTHSGVDGVYTADPRTDPAAVKIEKLSHFDVLARAPPALVEKLRVDYYGSEVPLQQLAGFSVPEARVLVIAPYDKGALKAIEKAIQASDLGVNPSNDGALIRLTFPELTTDRRKEL